MADAQAIEAFIERWGPAGGGERSNYQMFLTELCDLIGVAKPEPAVELERQNAYVFERKVSARRLDGATSANFIDLYKRGCFVLEAKQSAKRLQQIANLRQLKLEIPELRVGSGRRDGQAWDTLMRQAREQAESYAKRLPSEEGWPPFLVIVDVGHVIELYADFSLQGKHYAQFPDRQSFRIYLEELRDEAVLERLRKVWEEPQSLDPASRSAKVTREVADLLAQLSKGLETRMLRTLPLSLSSEQRLLEERTIAEKVALFLMRCLFTMFAEDIGLLERGTFTALLKSYKGSADRLHFALGHLWQDMDRGGYSTDLRADLLQFNGGLFRNAVALPIDEDELALLIVAAERDWKDVEPAIFGTLLERALHPRERHKLGAHYTPRAYVERLVVATIIEPLTEEWRNIQAVAVQLIGADEAEKARVALHDFHRRLCSIRVLDPACGTGNFLYVAMELMKRLEGEVLEALKDLGEGQENLDLDRHTVDPHQFLGLELNPRAVAIAELVLWIGYLQWHFRTRGKTLPAQPVLKHFANIVERDAVLEFDRTDLLRDADGRPITRWDGVTYKLHPITGEEVPDAEAQMELRTYRNPRPADWPQADFIVGNPPFIGGKDMRQALGAGYAEACWKARPHIPGGADFVMHFWDKAAETVRSGKARRFGLITTNSITQSFNRRVIERHLGANSPLSLTMAVPDHPWLKATDKAAVRIAMTVGVAGQREGALRTVLSERDLNSDSPKVELAEWRGKIHANLSVGTDLSEVKPLRANGGLCSRGVQLHGAGFIVTPSQAAVLGLGTVPDLEAYIRPYRNGRDLTAHPRGVMVIDLYPLAEAEVRERFPAVYQWLADHVRPEREAQRGKTNDATEYAERWWQFGKVRPVLRKALGGLSRYIATVETSKHRFFQFLDASIRPDNMLVSFGLDDAFHLGVLSSRIHVAWALAMGGTLEDRPRYNKTRCFDTFPFPAPSKGLRHRINALAENLDAHRKAVLDRHRQLTMTGLYNVLEKVRAGRHLSEPEQDIYEAGLVGVLRELHDDLDRAVAEAYGWPHDLPYEAILANLNELNGWRRAEEQDAHVRWLRPDFQAPAESFRRPSPHQIEATLVARKGAEKKPKLPLALPDQVAAIRDILATTDMTLTAAALARCFAQGRRIESKVEDVLETLTLLGQAERSSDGYALTH